MKRFFLTFCIMINLLAGFSYATNEGPAGNIFSVDLKRGPLEVSIGDANLMIGADSHYLGYETNLLTFNGVNFIVNSGMKITDKVNTAVSNQNYFYTFIQSGHISTIDLTRSDFPSIFGEQKLEENNFDYVRDISNNKYILRTKKNEKDVFEYSAITLFRNGVGIITSDFTETNVGGRFDPEHLGQFMIQVNEFKPKSGQAYGDYRIGDKNYDGNLKDFLSNLLQRDKVQPITGAMEREAGYNLRTGDENNSKMFGSFALSNGKGEVGVKQWIQQFTNMLPANNLFSNEDRKILVKGSLYGIKFAQYKSDKLYWAMYLSVFLILLGGFIGIKRNRSLFSIKSMKLILVEVLSEMKRKQLTNRKTYVPLPVLRIETVTDGVTAPTDSNKTKADMDKFELVPELRRRIDEEEYSISKESLPAVVGEHHLVHEKEKAKV